MSTGTPALLKTIHVEGRLWFDKKNGNTYHSARVTIDGDTVLAVPFQYGYGDQYVYSAQEAMAEAGIVPMDRHPNGSVQPLWQVAREHGIGLTYDAAYVGRREAEAWGTL